MQRTLKDIQFAYSRDRLIVKAKVLNTFNKYEQKKGTDELGGILLGYVYGDRTEIVRVTTPSRFDKYGLGFFVRSRVNAQAQINKAWGKSDGTLIYLGEWHTHPETNPKPSNVDRRMIMNSLKETNMEIDFLYLIIVGGNHSYWVGKRTKRKLTELKRIGEY